MSQRKRPAGNRPSPKSTATDYAHSTHLQHTAITNCQLCDNDGYRGTRICDHRDHFTDTANGRAMVQAELAKIHQRRKTTQSAEPQ